MEIEIGTTVELDLTFVASVSPGSPGRMTGPPELCYESEPPEVEDVRVVLTWEQAIATRGAVAQYVSQHLGHDSDTEGVPSDPGSLVAAILIALKPDILEGRCEQFLEAMDERERE